jgi:hypothetical protein
VITIGNAGLERPAVRALYLLILLGTPGAVRSGQGPEDRVLAAVDSCLPRLLDVQNRVRDIHPYLGGRHPVAVVEDGQFYVFDADPATGKYRFVKKAPVEFQLPENVMASFPLACYGNRPSCVVTRRIFDSLNGYVTILHEFVHCGQAEGCEQALKKRLPVAVDAMKRQDYAWEINHAFPYQDSAFVSEYGGMLNTLEERKFESVREHVQRLKIRLTPADYEYMVWIEWKEGLARLLENRMQTRLGLPVNRFGENTPYHRVTFYCGGAGLIDWLSAENPALFTDGEGLFHRLFDLGDP